MSAAAEAAPVASDPKSPLIIFTGAFDGTIKIWAVPKRPARGAIHRAALSVTPQLLATLSGHTASVNTLVFAPTGRRFFTGDGVGIVKVWDDNAPLTSPTGTSKTSKRHARDSKHAAGAGAESDSDGDDDVWGDGEADATQFRGVPWAKRFQCSHTMAVSSSASTKASGAAAAATAGAATPKGATDSNAPGASAGSAGAAAVGGTGAAAVTSATGGNPLASVHASSIHALAYVEERNGANGRLVAYCRNNTLVLFSLSRWDVRRTFSGVDSRHGTMRCAISPDGTFLVAGSEDGKAYFWELSGGRLVSVLDIGYFTPLCDVTWHPTEHLVGFASYGVDAPFALYQYAPAYMADAQYDEPTVVLARQSAAANLSLVGNDADTDFAPDPERDADAPVINR